MTVTVSCSDTNTRTALLRGTPRTRATNAVARAATSQTSQEHQSSCLSDTRTHTSGNTNHSHSHSQLQRHQHSDSAAARHPAHACHQCSGACSYLADQSGAPVQLPVRHTHTHQRQHQSQSQSQSAAATPTLGQRCCAAPRARVPPMQWRVQLPRRPVRSTSPAACQTHAHTPAATPITVTVTVSCSDTNTRTALLRGTPRTRATNAVARAATSQTSQEHHSSCLSDTRTHTSGNTNHSHSHSQLQRHQHSDSAAARHPAHACHQCSGACSYLADQSGAPVQLPVRHTHTHQRQHQSQSQSQSAAATPTLGQRCCAAPRARVPPMQWRVQLPHRPVRSTTPAACQTHAHTPVATPITVTVTVSCSDTNTRTALQCGTPRTRGTTAVARAATTQSSRKHHSSCLSDTRTHTSGNSNDSTVTVSCSDGTLRQRCSAAPRARVPPLQWRVQLPHRPVRSTTPAACQTHAHTPAATTIQSQSQSAAATPTLGQRCCAAPRARVAPMQWRVQLPHRPVGSTTPAACQTHAHTPAATAMTVTSHSQLQRHQHYQRQHQSQPQTQSADRDTNTRTAFSLRRGSEVVLHLQLAKRNVCCICIAAVC